MVDASVALKWVRPEVDSEAALALRDRLVAEAAPVHVPDLFWAETANVLWRLGRAAVLEPDDARAALEALRAAPLRTEAVEPLSGRALEIALETGATVYDAVYVALAELLGARLWTADDRLARAVTGTRWQAVVARLDDAPDDPSG